jgi:DNA-directed RNA polymerase III subunit RPC4
VKKEGGGSYTRFGGSGSGSGEQFSIPEPQYPNVDNAERAVDIAHINLISDDEDEVQYLGARRTKTTSNSGIAPKSLKPVRLMREEHRERVLLVNTETTKIKKEGDDDDMPIVDEKRSSKSAPKPREFQGVYQDTDVQVKTEPGTTPEPTGPPIIKDSPDSKRKTQDALASSTPMIVDSTPDGEALAAAKERKARPPTKKLTKKPVIQTEEDRAEYHRHQEDIRILTQELGGMQGSQADDKGKGKAKDTEGDVAMDDATPPASDDKHGRLYLFQFPPVLPELYNPAGPKPRTLLQIKKEEEEAAAKAKIKIEGKEDVAVTGAGSKAKGKLKDRVDLTGEPAPAIKLEEGVETVEEKAKREAEDKKRKSKKAEIVHEEGYVGKLIVRESGRVELQWGGVTLLVGRGAEAAFLTTGVVIDSTQVGPVGSDGPAQGKANGMGQIMGKFVVTPDWESYASGSR